MNRSLSFSLIVFAALLIGAPVADASREKPRTKDFDAYAVVDTAGVVDNEPAGDSMGDILVATQKLYTDQSQTNQIGTDHVYCVRTVVGVARICTGIFYLKGGLLTITGSESLEPHALAITGGTGKYRGARGQVDLVPDSPVADRMSFHIIR